MYRIMGSRKRQLLYASIALTASLTLLAAWVGPAFAADQVTLNGYDITFDGVTYNQDGTSTWTYTVDPPGSGSFQDLSHWVLGLCVPNNGGFVSSDPQGVLGTDPTTGVYGIKWETQIDATSSDPVAHTFVLDAWYAVVDTDVVVKAGPSNYYGLIDGPACSLAAEIGDRVWHDESGAGDQNANFGVDEPGFDGVDVYLYGSQPTVCGETGYLESTTTQSGTSQTPDGFPDGIYGFVMGAYPTGTYWVCVDESTLPDPGPGLTWASTTGGNTQQVTYTGVDDFSFDFGYVAEAETTAVTLSAFSVSPGVDLVKVLAVAAVPVLVMIGGFWAKRRIVGEGAS